ncbi:LysR family transcriptional regulator [Siculibacillus lacustris]|uniref:LysR family transcriptional regulator n=1 Tax=Siculibacillus lacustris TaxID=1549641 RepID=A0A4Q9VZF6_9HYPH|nr:LysR family transcriptional regulator [Siculibacillus lacustris]TBW40766.1 LysR family transcriptional regulator [Siculibacillus lacustris]
MDTFTRMQALIQVVEAGGFSAAARKAGKSKALLSKYVRDLEDELGVRLLNRTTRQLSMTEVGQAYHREAVEILQRLEELAASVSDSHGEPRGHLRVSGPRSLGDADLGRAVTEFLVTHPDITIDLRLDDRFVDLVEEGFDVAIRVSEPLDSSLIARRLSTFRVVCCASPDWIARHGRPAVPTDLAGLPAIVDTNARNWSHWPFLVDNERVVVAVTARMNANSPLVTAVAAEAGLGVARIPWFAVRRAVEEGRLELLLEAYEPKTLAINAVYPHRRHLSGKVRAFVDFLVAWFERRRKIDPTT